MKPSAFTVFSSSSHMVSDLIATGSSPSAQDSSQPNVISNPTVDPSPEDYSHEATGAPLTPPDSNQAKHSATQSRRKTVTPAKRSTEPTVTKVTKGRKPSVKAPLFNYKGALVPSSLTDLQQRTEVPVSKVVAELNSILLRVEYLDAWNTVAVHDIHTLLAYKYQISRCFLKSLYRYLPDNAKDVYKRLRSNKNQPRGRDLLCTPIVRTDLFKPGTRIHFFDLIEMLLSHPPSDTEPFAYRIQDISIEHDCHLHCTVAIDLMNTSLIHPNLMQTDLHVDQTLELRTTSNHPLPGSQPLPCKSFVTKQGISLTIGGSNFISSFENLLLPNEDCSCDQTMGMDDGSSSAPDQPRQHHSNLEEEYSVYISTNSIQSILDFYSLLIHFKGKTIPLTSNVVKTTFQVCYKTLLDCFLDIFSKYKTNPSPMLEKRLIRAFAEVSIVPTLLLLFPSSSWKRSPPSKIDQIINNRWNYFKECSSQNRDMDFEYYGLFNPVKTFRTTRSSNRLNLAQKAMEAGQMTKAYSIIDTDFNKSPISEPPPPREIH